MIQSGCKQRDSNMANSATIYHEFKTVIKGRKVKIVLSTFTTPDNPDDIETNPFKYIHYHIYYELFILNKNQALSIYTKSGIKDFKDCVFCIPPLLSHYAFSSNNCIVISVTPVNEKEHFSKHSDPRKIVVFDRTPLIEQCADAINELAYSNNLIEEKQLQSLVQCILYEIISQESTAKTNKTKKNSIYENRLINFETTMCSEFLNDITIEDIAQKLFLSTRQVSRLIKENYNKTFTQFLNEKRLEAACVLLKTTNLSISEISEKTHFISPSYFFRVFKKYYKTTPLKYKRDDLRAL